MALGDKMRRASAEVRSATAGRSREPMGQVRRRVGLQRVFAFGAGTLVVLVTVGVAALAGGGGGDVELLPVGDQVTTTVDFALTTTTTAEAPPIDPTTTPPGSDDGLSDPTGLPESWLDEIEIEDGAQLLLLDSGIGMVARRSGEESGEGWELSIVEANHFGILYTFADDHELGSLPAVMVSLAIHKDEGLVTVYGIAPTEAESVSIGVNGRHPVVVDRVYRRDGVDRSVFIGSVDQSALFGGLVEIDSMLRTDSGGELQISNAPNEVVVWVAGAAGANLSVPPIEFRSAAVAMGYDGLFTPELFVDPGPLVVDSISVASFPEVVECGGAPGVETPPNQGRVVTDSKVSATPLAALELILDGELADTWFPHGGYVEVTDSEGNVAFGKPLSGDTVDLGVVMLIELAQVDGGWVVTKWEGSGC